MLAISISNMTKWTTAKIVFLFWFVMQVKTQNSNFLPFLARGVPLCNVHSPVGRRGLFNHFVDVDICCSRYSRSFGCYPIPAEIDQGLIGNWHFELSVFLPETLLSTIYQEKHWNWKLFWDCPCIFSTWVG